MSQEEDDEPITSFSEFKRKNSFYSRLIYIIKARDYIHSKLKDNVSLKDRPRNKYIKWATYHTSRSYLQSIGFYEVIKPHHIKVFKLNQIIAISIDLKPFTDDDLKSGSNNIDCRMWQIYSAYRFPQRYLVTKLTHDSNSVSDGPMCDPGTSFEKILFFSLLGDVRTSNMLRPRKYPFFSQRSECLNTFAWGLQCIVRAWDDLARCLNFCSIEQLIAPYIIMDRNSWRYRALSVEEGFAPKSQRYSFDEGSTTTCVAQESYPETKSRTSEANSWLRRLAKIFLKDLDQCLINEQLFNKDRTRWQGYVFLEPLRDTPLKYRFEKFEELLNPIRASLRVRESSPSSPPAWLPTTVSTGRDFNDETSFKDEVNELRSAKKRRRYYFESPSRHQNSTTSKDNGAAHIFNSERGALAASTAATTAPIAPVTTTAAITPVTTTTGAAPAVVKLALTNEVIVLDEDLKCEDQECKHEITFRHEVPADLPKISMPPRVIIDVIARKERRFNLIKRGHDEGPEEWSPVDLHAVVHADARWLLAVEGYEFGLYVKSSMVLPENDGLFARKAFKPGDLIALVHGAIAYDCGEKDGKRSTVRIVYGDGNPAVDRHRFSNFAVALPNVSALWKVDEGLNVKRVYIVPSRACIGSKMVNLQTLHDGMNDNCGESKHERVSMIPNAVLVVGRRIFGDMEKSHLWASDTVEIIASKHINIDDEICGKFNTGEIS